MTNQQPEFPSYFDPDREAKAAAREQVDRPQGDRPEGYEGYENYPSDGQTGAERDGMIEVDELGNPVDPNDPDLRDLQDLTGDPYGTRGVAGQAGPLGAILGGGMLGNAFGGRGAGPRVSMFPFPGISGTTRGGMRYSVGGCCLPIPLFAMAATAALGAVVGKSLRG